MTKISNKQTIKEVQEMLDPIKERISNLEENKKDDFTLKWSGHSLKNQVTDKEKQEFHRHLADLMKTFKIVKLEAKLEKKW